MTKKLLLTGSSGFVGHRQYMQEKIEGAGVDVKYNFKTGIEELMKMQDISRKSFEKFLVGDWEYIFIEAAEKRLAREIQRNQGDR